MVLRTASLRLAHEASGTLAVRKNTSRLEDRDVF